MPVPRFDPLQPSSTAASRIKKRVRSRDTKAELILRSNLHKRGLRFRLHAPHLVGRPDIVFVGARLLVFVDGDYWHGRDWARRRRKLAAGANSEYWLSKIRSNMKRDRKQTKLLQRAGWRVLRIWETDVLRDPECATELIAILLKSQNR